MSGCPRRIEFAERWRGHGFGGALMATGLRVMARDSRPQLCRLSPHEFTRRCRKRAVGRTREAAHGQMLKRISSLRLCKLPVLGLRRHPPGLAFGPDRQFGGRAGTASTIRKADFVAWGVSVSRETALAEAFSWQVHRV